MEHSDRATDVSNNGADDITDDVLLAPISSADHSLVDPEMTSDQPLDDPEMTGDQPLDDPEMTADQSLVDPEMTGDQEELIILDPEHPLVRRYQAALKKHLSQQLERLIVELKEKLAVDRAEGEHREQLGERLYGVQEQLNRSQASVERQHQAAAAAAQQRRLTQEQLLDAKKAFDTDACQAAKERSHVSQLQAEMDNLSGRLLYLQQVTAGVQSDVSAMRNATRKAQQDKSHAAGSKHRQDLYVERLTKDMDRLTEQINVYEDQLKTQREETHAATEALTEAQMEMDSLQMEHKQLLQQWNSSLMDMKQQDATFTSLQETLSAAHQQVVLLDREMEGFNKSVIKEEERNELLTSQLRKAQLHGATSRRLIDHSLSQQDALQANYSTYTRTLQETESTLRRLNVESASQGVELGGLTNQLQQQSSVCVELTNSIVELMQQEVTHNKEAQHRKQLRSKMAALYKDKTSQLWQLENETAAASLASGEVRQRLDGLSITLLTLEQEVSDRDAKMAADQANMAAGVTAIQRKQDAINACNKRIQQLAASTGDAINACNKRIQQLAASTGHADLSPLQIRVESLSKALEELRVEIQREQQLWSRQQGELVRLSQERHSDTEHNLRLHTHYTLLEHRKIRTEGDIVAEQREQKAVEKNMKTLRSDVLKLNSLLSQNGVLENTLEADNNLLQNTYLLTLKEAEGGVITMQNRLDNILEEKTRLLNVLVEAERQIMLWEKKIQMTKESRSVVDSTVGREEIMKMKAEIHRMEVHYNQLTRRQQQLMRDSEASVSRREHMVVRREAQGRGLDHNPPHTSHNELNRCIMGLTRNVHNVHKQVSECDQQVKDLLLSKASLSESLQNHRLRLPDLQMTYDTLTSDLHDLQDTKDRDFLSLLSLQTRAKHLQKACEGHYTPLTSDPSMTPDPSLQQQTNRVQTVRTIVHCVCEQFPQHQETLRRLTLALSFPAPGE